MLHSSPKFPSSPDALPTAIRNVLRLDNVNQAVELWIETAREFGDPSRSLRAHV